MASPLALYELLVSYTKTQACIAACELKIFDVLESGSKTVDEIAQLIQADVGCTERILNACVGIGILRKDSEGSAAAVSDSFANTPSASKYLTSSTPLSMRPLFIGMGRTDYPLVGNLVHAAREGAPQIERTFGKHGYFDDLFNDPDERRGFMTEMHSYSSVFMRELIKDFDLSSFKKVCDLGGCTGALGHALSAAYPEMKVTVFDLPKVVEMAEDFTPIDPKSPNVRYQEGDFFVDPLPASDLFILSNILHDWSEEHIDKLLSNAFTALEKGGGIFIIEALYDDDKTGPLATSAICMMMMVWFQGGKQRNSVEMQGLLEKHGFSDVQIKRSGSVYDTVLARKY
ncbi:acetylserotonin O-methyltransferase-like [Glandiceps talaboti]